ncbi:YceK/YidQ family lipoprotein [Colwellia sp. KU-HH00111]|uniref:YceK/YidQ family lipoprotein n=1 Tax=Colwellia sp. KU-HH00111 TaxID=3127652 RepID=UPI0031058C72
MKGFVCLSLALCTFSCATIKTLNPPNNHVTISHYSKKSYCEHIPRVYSGISYNICLFYGEPSKTENVGSTLNNIPFVVIDSAFSVVSDTLVLPYTLVMQAEEGPINVN